MMRQSDWIGVSSLILQMLTYISGVPVEKAHRVLGADEHRSDSLAGGHLGDP